MRGGLFCLSCGLVIALATAALSGVVVTPYGHAQYRLRMKAYVRDSASGDENIVSKKYEYKNRIAYFLGTKAVFDEQFLLQFQIGNDWVFTGPVDWEANNNWMAKSGNYPFFHLAYAAWDPGAFHLAFGIQPLVSHGPLDLLERSIRGNAYDLAAWLSWPVGTNNSMMGLSVGAPVLTNDFKLGIDLFSTVVTDRPDQFLEDPAINPNGILNVVTVPMAAGKLSIAPQAYALLFKEYSSVTGEGDHEFGAGFSARYALGDKSYLRVLAAGSRNSNENSRLDSEALVTYQGIIAGVSGSFAAGPGSISAAFTWSSSENIEVEESIAHYLYSDLKYGWGVRKGLVLMPRVRTFTMLPNESSDITYQLEIRPELIFIGSF